MAWTQLLLKLEIKIQSYDYMDMLILLPTKGKLTKVMVMSRLSFTSCPIQAEGFLLNWPRCLAGFLEVRIILDPCFAMIKSALYLQRRQNK